ncbi:hypothetical protein B0H10DRAFT_1949568 [Mycena sp. CBHHK59/15]|nr:hypothetical protein B0H10DRAFT_1949568 [Mycena sp. CBHHK59/15]
MQDFKQQMVHSRPKKKEKPSHLKVLFALSWTNRLVESWCACALSLGAAISYVVPEYQHVSNICCSHTPIPFPTPLHPPLQPSPGFWRSHLPHAPRFSIVFNTTFPLLHVTLEHDNQIEWEMGGGIEEEVPAIAVGQQATMGTWTTDLDLTWALITAIEEDEETSASLFPGHQAKAEEGVVQQDKELTQTTHLDFHKQFIAISLTTKACEHIVEMGQTGARIRTEDEILPRTALTTKWVLPHADPDCGTPKPSACRLGNNNTVFDTCILPPSHDDDDQFSAADETQDQPKQLTDVECQDDPKPLQNGSKPAKKKMKPQPPTSVHATLGVPAKKDTTAKDLFAVTVLAEEETAQWVLRLKWEKTTAQKEVALMKIQMESELHMAQAESKRLEKAAKMDLVHLKMEQEHQFRWHSSMLSQVKQGQALCPFQAAAAPLTAAALSCSMTSFHPFPLPLQMAQMLQGNLCMGDSEALASSHDFSL